MIVKNEESVLGRCLNSIKNAVDEIIIVDTGSTDKTKKIAKEFTNKVYDFEWIDDFSIARNFSFSKATMEYQMWLDADDIISDSERKKIIQLKNTLGHDIDIVTMKYHTHFDPDENPIVTSTRERLFKKERKYLWQDPIHEYILMSGNILHSDIAICHKKEISSGNRNIKIYEHQINQGKTLSPRSTYYFARELMDLGRYREAIDYFNRFLNDGLGWFEDNIATCFNLSKCYDILNMKDKILPILLKSFEYDTPRAEICCQIGYCYKNKSDYKKAIFWFELSLSLTKNSYGFILNDYWDYIPSIELCSCYSLIGNIEQAFHYHKLSSSYKPNNSGVKYNKTYFEQLGYID